MYTFCIRMFYLNYEECKVKLEDNEEDTDNGFILTMRNVKSNI